MGFFGKTVTDQERAEELFSAYLDGQVTAEERVFLDRYLATHPEARDKFEMLQSAVRLTKTLPMVKAPRSFVLPRSMARKPSLALRLYPTLRLATVAATALFVFALVGDLTTTSQRELNQAAPSVPLAAQPTQLTTTQAYDASVTVVPAAPPAPGEPEATEAPTLEQAVPEPTATVDPLTFSSTLSMTDATANVAPTDETARAAAPTQAPPDAAAGSALADGDQFASKAADPAVTTLTPILVWRIVEIVFAGLAVILAATTLIVRRRAR